MSSRQSANQTEGQKQVSEDADEGCCRLVGLSPAPLAAYLLCALLAALLLPSWAAWDQVSLLAASARVIFPASVSWILFHTLVSRLPVAPLLCLVAVGSIALIPSLVVLVPLAGPSPIYTEPWRASDLALLADTSVSVVCSDPAMVIPELGSLPTAFLDPTDVAQADHAVLALGEFFVALGPQLETVYELASDGQQCVGALLPVACSFYPRADNGCTVLPWCQAECQSVLAACFDLLLPALPGQAEWDLLWVLSEPYLVNETNAAMLEYRDDLLDHILLDHCLVPTQQLDPPDLLRAPMSSFRPSSPRACYDSSFEPGAGGLCGIDAQARAEAAYAAEVAAWHSRADPQDRESARIHQGSRLAARFSLLLPLSICVLGLCWGLAKNKDARGERSNVCRWPRPAREVWPHHRPRWILVVLFALVSLVALSLVMLWFSLRPTLTSGWLVFLFSLLGFLVALRGASIPRPAAKAIRDLPASSFVVRCYHRARRSRRRWQWFNRPLGLDGAFFFYKFVPMTAVSILVQFVSLVVNVPTSTNGVVVVAFGLGLDCVVSPLLALHPSVLMHRACLFCFQLVMSCFYLGCNIVIDLTRVDSLSLRQIAALVVPFVSAVVSLQDLLDWLRVQLLTRFDDDGRPDIKVPGQWENDEDILFVDDAAKAADYERSLREGTSRHSYSRLSEGNDQDPHTGQSGRVTRASCDSDQFRASDLDIPDIAYDEKSRDEEDNELGDLSGPRWERFCLQAGRAVRMPLTVGVVLGGVALIVTTAVRLTRQTIQCEQIAFWDRLTPHNLFPSGLWGATSCNLASYTHIDLRGSPLTSLSADVVSQLTGLRSLDLSNSAISSQGLPLEILACLELRSLSVTNTAVALALDWSTQPTESIRAMLRVCVALPRHCRSWLARLLPSVTSLNLSTLPLPILPFSVAQLPTLARLDVHGMFLAGLPMLPQSLVYFDASHNLILRAVLSRASPLFFSRDVLVNLRHNQIRECFFPPTTFDPATNNNSLLLGGNSISGLVMRGLGLTEWPVSLLSELQDLQALDLSHNEFALVPVSVSIHSQLTSLSLDDSPRLVGVSASLSDLAHLRELSLRNCSSLQGLSAVTGLTLSYLNLEQNSLLTTLDLMAMLQGMDLSLQHLDVRGGNFTAGSLHLSPLFNLQTLGVRHKAVSTWPSMVSDLYLDAQGNVVETLPEEVFSLPLRALRVSEGLLFDNLGSRLSSSWPLQSLCASFNDPLAPVPGLLGGSGLQHLKLWGNNFFPDTDVGLDVPDSAIASLINLRVLVLNNAMVPPTIVACRDLTALSVRSNGRATPNVTGLLPQELTQLQKLEILDIEFSLASDLSVFATHTQPLLRLMPNLRFVWVRHSLFESGLCRDQHFVCRTGDALTGGLLGASLCEFPSASTRRELENRNAPHHGPDIQRR